MRLNKRQETALEAALEALEYSGGSYLDDDRYSQAADTIVSMLDSSRKTRLKSQRKSKSFQKDES